MNTASIWLKLFMIFSLIFIVTFIGCSTSFYKVNTIQDEFDGYTINRMEDNTLSGGGLLGDRIEINAQKFTTKDGDKLYSLIVEYGGEGWLFIRKGESLILLVDGKRIGFTGEGSSGNRDVLYGNAVMESAFYDISPKDLVKISRAKNIKVKIVGNKYYFERNFSEKNFENFKKFVVQYVLNKNK